MADEERLRRGRRRTRDVPDADKAVTVSVTLYRQDIAELKRLGRLLFPEKEQNISGTVRWLLERSADMAWMQSHASIPAGQRSEP